MSKKKKKEQNIKTRKEKQPRDSKGITYFQYILTAVVAVILFYPPYFRGLFFDGEMLLSQALIFGVFIAFIVYKLFRGGKIISSHMDYVLGAFCIVYALSLINAVVPREAWLEFLAVCAYFAVFLMVSRLSDESNYRWFVYALVLGAVGVSFIGIGTGFGSFDFPGAERGQRIYSSLQYPNTTAALLTAGFFVAVSRIEGESKSIIKGLLGGAAFFILITFVFTMSRAAWLVFPLMLMIYWLVNARKFVSTFIYSIIPLAVFLPLAMPIWEAVQEGEASGWYYAGAGIAVSGVLTFVFAYFFAGLERIQRKVFQYMAVGVLALVVLAGSYYGITNYEAALDMMPEVVERRIDRIDFDETGFTTRVELMETAWEMTKDRPLLGAGGGGWESLYQQYMSRDYWTTEVHSHLFQVGVETGVTGMVAFVGALVALAYQFVYVLIKKAGEGAEYVQSGGVFVGAVALAGHSIVDFNLSLGAVAIYLWALFGLLNYFYLREKEGEHDLAGDDDNKRKKVGKNEEGENSFNARINEYFPYVVGVIAFGMMMYSLVVYHGFSEGQRARAYAEQGRLEEAVSSYETAISNDHLNAELHYDLLSTYEEIYRHTGEDRFILNAIETAERALELNPYYPSHLRRYGQFMLRVGNIDEGLSHLEKAYQYHIHGDRGFKAYANGLVSASQHYIEEGEPDKASEHLEKVLELRDEFLEYHSQDGEFDINVLKAYVFRKEYEKAEEFVEEVSLPGDDIDSELFKALAYQGNGKKEEAENVIGEFEGEDEEEEEMLEAKFKEYKELLGL